LELEIVWFSLDMGVWAVKALVSLGYKRMEAASDVSPRRAGFQSARLQKLVDVGTSRLHRMARFVRLGRYSSDHPGIALSPMSADWLRSNEERSWKTGTD